MPFHLGGFLEDVDPAAAFVDIAALVDDRLFQQGDDIRVPSQLTNIVALAAGVDNAVASRARLDSPTLDAMTRFDINPLNMATGDVEPGSPHAVMDLRRNPLVLGADEILGAQILSNPSAVADQWVLCWFADGPITSVENAPIFQARATGTTTVTARAWTQVNLTLDDQLPPGTYQVVGARFESATCIAGRIVFRTGDFWRPGALGVDDEADLGHPMWRRGGMGVWGEFPFTQLPAAEFLCDVADTAEIVFLDLVKVG